MSSQTWNLVNLNLRCFIKIPGTHCSYFHQILKSTVNHFLEARELFPDLGRFWGSLRSRPFCMNPFLSS